MDEGDSAMNEVEMRAAVISMAAGAREFYDALMAEGFNETDAMKLTSAWVAGMMGGHRS